MNRFLLAVLAVCLSVAAYGQGKKARLKVWREEVKAGREFVKDYSDTAGLSNIPIAEYFGLEEIDIPKNYEKILRSHPCWVVKSITTAGVRDVELYVIKKEYRNIWNTYIDVFEFTRKGYIYYFIADSMSAASIEQPRVGAKFVRYDAPFEKCPPKVFMCGKNNKYVVGYETIVYDNQTPKGSGEFLMYIIEPASREQLKEMKSLIKKSAVVAQYYQDISDFMKKNNL